MGLMQMKNSMKKRIMKWSDEESDDEESNNEEEDEVNVESEDRGK